MTDWSDIRDCWLSGQIEPSEMQAMMDADPDFAAWMREQAGESDAE